MRGARGRTPLARACPRDREPLREHHADRVNVDVCPKCHGTFLDGIELHRVLGDTELALELARMQGKVQEDLRCPACGATMSLNTLDGITLDHCRACLGVWLDHGEMERLASRNLTSFARARAPVLDMTLRDIALSLKRGA